MSFKFTFFFFHHHHPSSTHRINGKISFDAKCIFIEFSYIAHSMKRSSTKLYFLFIQQWINLYLRWPHRFISLSLLLRSFVRCGSSEKLRCNAIAKIAKQTAKVENVYCWTFCALHKFKLSSCVISFSPSPWFHFLPNRSANKFSFSVKLFQ